MSETSPNRSRVTNLVRVESARICAELVSVRADSNGLAIRTGNAKVVSNVDVVQLNVVALDSKRPRRVVAASLASR